MKFNLKFISRLGYHTKLSYKALYKCTAASGDIFAPIVLKLTNSVIKKLLLPYMGDHLISHLGPLGIVHHL